jgi:hypothetical protein
VTVFVSYSSRDKDAVKGLVQDLQDADEQVWMDRRLAGGEAWWRAILEQIRGCEVFIFALSQNSLDSKPCQAELNYAQALGSPILPVQVGSVDSMQLNPLAAVHTIDYRHQTPNTGMRLITALNRERGRRQPLPDPLPDEPPVPFEYLIRLYTTISNPDYLTPRDQAALVAQLQVGLGEDGQHEAARKDIVMLLTKLHDREDATHRTRTDVEAVLASIDPEENLRVGPRTAGVATHADTAPSSTPAGSPSPAEPQAGVRGSHSTSGQTESAPQVTDGPVQQRTETPRTFGPGDTAAPAAVFRDDAQPALDQLTSAPAKATTVTTALAPTKKDHAPRRGRKIVIKMLVAAVILAIIGVPIVAVIWRQHNHAWEAYGKEGSITENPHYVLFLLGCVCLVAAGILISATLVMLIVRAIRRAAGSAPVQRAATSAAHSIATRLTTALPKDDSDQIARTTSSGTATSTDDHNTG